MVTHCLSNSDSNSRRGPYRSPGAGSAGLHNPGLCISQERQVGQYSWAPRETEHFRQAPHMGERSWDFHPLLDSVQASGCGASGGIKLQRVWD